jgi:pilus assembly protein Flp/PilA
MLEFIRNITSRRNQDGASAVEYGLLVAGIAGLVAAIVFVFGNAVMGLFDTTCASIAEGSNGNMSVDCSTP